MAASTRARHRRRQQMLAYLIEKYEPECFVCSRRITTDEFESKSRDGLTIHHRNHVHEDDRIENRTLMHRDCHQVHHKTCRRLGTVIDERGVVMPRRA
jgi:hypothetical protein